MTEAETFALFYIVIGYMGGFASGVAVIGLVMYVRD